MILMILLSVIGTWSGKFILDWMPEKTFRNGFNLILTLLALRLLYEAGVEVFA